MTPDEFIPIHREPERLGFGLKSPSGVYRRAKADPAFPPIWLIKGKNYILANDAAAYSAKRAQRALVAPSNRGRRG